MAEIKKEEIDRYVNNAIEIAYCVSSLESPLVEIMFRQIIRNLYAVCEFLPKEKKLKQFIHLICMNFSMSKDPEKLLLLLISSDKLPKYFNEIKNKKSDVTEDSEQTKEKRNDMMKFLDEKEVLMAEITESSIQAREKLNDLLFNVRNDEFCINDNEFFNYYNLFTEPIVDKISLFNMKEKLYEKIKNLIKNNKSVISDNTDTECTEFLGCQTLLSSWFDSKDSSEKLDRMFFRWYCKGELLDVIIDAMANSDTHFIVKSFMQHLDEWCKDDSRLGEILQERYNLYRQYSTRLPNHAFWGIEQKSTNSIEYVCALDKIPDLKGKDYDDSLGKLYGRSIRRYVDCDIQTFKSAFSGSNETKMITWLENVNDLAVFLSVLYNGKNKNKYSEKAANIFLVKGKHPKSGALSQETQHKEYDKKKKEFIEILNECGFEK